MASKYRKTECSALDWEQFLLLIDRLKKTTEYRFLLLICIGCYCGLRLSDILQLRWKDILEKEYFELAEKKTGKHRRITINSSLKEIIDFSHTSLQKRKEIQPGEFVFVNRQGGVLSKQFVNRKLHSIFQEYRVRVQNGSSHTLRKTFGRRVYEMNDRSEAALILLSSIFNHNSVAVTRQYIGLSQEQINDVYINL
jgi:integrase